MAKRFEPETLNSIRLEDEFNTDDLFDILLIATGRFPWSAIPEKESKDKLEEEMEKEYRRRGSPLSQNLTVEEIRDMTEDVYCQRQQQHKPVNQSSLQP